MSEDIDLAGKPSPAAAQPVPEYENTLLLGMFSEGVQTVYPS